MENVHVVSRSPSIIMTAATYAEIRPSNVHKSVVAKRTDLAYFCEGDKLPEITEEVVELHLNSTDAPNTEDSKTLKVLSLHDCKRGTYNVKVAPSVGKISIYDSDFDASIFKTADNLKEIRITNSRVVGNLYENIKHLSGLKSLALIDMKITCMHKYTSFEELEHLEISHNHLGNISFMKGMKLKSLKAFNCNIDDMTPIEDMTSLKNLELGYNSVGGTDFVHNLVNLESLRLERNNIKEIRLGNKPCLTYLDLSNNKIDKVDSLREYPLVSLDLHHNNIFRIKPLAYIKTLKDLDISHNFIVDISPLDYLNLRKVDFCRNHIVDKSKLFRSPQRPTDVTVGDIKHSMMKSSLDVVINYIRKTYPTNQDIDLSMIPDRTMQRIIYNKGLMELFHIMWPVLMATDNASLIVEILVQDYEKACAIGKCYSFVSLVCTFCSLPMPIHYSLMFRHIISKSEDINGNVDYDTIKEEIEQAYEDYHKTMSFYA